MRLYYFGETILQRASASHNIRSLTEMQLMFPEVYAHKVSVHIDYLIPTMSC